MLCLFVRQLHFIEVKMISLNINVYVISSDFHLTLFFYFIFCLCLPFLCVINKAQFSTKNFVKFSGPVRKILLLTEAKLSKFHGLPWPSVCT